jgi:hypothetical protein
MTDSKKLPITPELHSRGFTSISPYPGPRPGLKPELSVEFRLRWAKPFYNGISTEPTGDLATKLRAVLADLSPAVVETLLGDSNWRTRITGAWFTALMYWRQFEEPIGELLLRSEVCYAGRGYCLALASFATPGAVGLLQRYLEFYLRHAECWYDQGDALAALFWLDERNGTSHAPAFLDLWHAFVANKPDWNLHQHRRSFAAQMERLEQIRVALR